MEYHGIIFRFLQSLRKGCGAAFYLRRWDAAADAINLVWMP
jgi:hypothetical protein